MAARVSLGPGRVCVCVCVGPSQLGLDKWFDANVRETSNYSPNDECSATATAAGPNGNGMLWRLRLRRHRHLLRQTHNSRKSASAQVS